MQWMHIGTYLTPTTTIEGYLVATVGTHAIVQRRKHNTGANISLHIHMCTQNAFGIMLLWQELEVDVCFIFLRK